MKLTDLEPCWLSPDLFVFRSPGGHGDLITCKRVAMSRGDQNALVYEKNPQYVGQTVVMTHPAMVWRIDGDDFSTMTVHPSIDHSPSGNWHGWVKAGEVT
jgi:hypothetical protein